MLLDEIHVQPEASYKGESVDGMASNNTDVVASIICASFYDFFVFT